MMMTTTRKSKRSEAPRVFFSKIRKRFFGNKVEFELNDEDVALMLQMGWIEKYLGAYMLTERGAQEILHFYKKGSK